MDSLRKKVIKLAHGKPELRPHLLPLLKKDAGMWGDDEVYAEPLAHQIDQAGTKAIITVAKGLKGKVKSIGWTTGMGYTYRGFGKTVQDWVAEIELPEMDSIEVTVRGTADNPDDPNSGVSYHLEVSPYLRSTLGAGASSAFEKNFPEQRNMSASEVVSYLKNLPVKISAAYDAAVGSSAASSAVEKELKDGMEVIRSQIEWYLTRKKHPDWKVYLEGTVYSSERGLGAGRSWMGYINVKGPEPKTPGARLVKEVFDKVQRSHTGFGAMGRAEFDPRSVWGLVWRIKVIYRIPQ